MTEIATSKLSVSLQREERTPTLYVRNSAGEESKIDLSQVDEYGEESFPTAPIVTDEVTGLQYRLLVKDSHDNNWQVYAVQLENGEFFDENGKLPRDRRLRRQARFACPRFAIGKPDAFWQVRLGTCYTNPHRSHPW